MVLSGFKRKNIQNRIDKELSKSVNNKFSSANRINSVLILVGENTEKSIKDIIAKELVVDVSKIVLLIFKNKFDKNSMLKNEITEKDFGWFGKIKNTEIEILMNTEYDLLLNYASNNLFLKSLTSASKSVFKVGFSNDEERLYDLMISDSENKVSVFNSELKKYLKILNKI